jgi:hypothetical protein
MSSHQQWLQQIARENNLHLWEDKADRFRVINALLPPLPCARTHWGCRCVRRFHVPTCLFCRWRREARGKYHNPAYWIDYVYLSMSWFYAPAYKVVNGKAFFGWVQVPTTLKIDPRGHFTMIRCSVIVALDKLAVKLKLKDNHRIANICEFLACYPTW